MRRYQGALTDSGRWLAFPRRAGDVVITTPSKCGTTWMQNIVAMLVLDRVDLGMPMGLLSPWLDMLTRSQDNVFALLAGQDHRRFIKTHTPLDGLPDDPDLTYIAVVRHPLDAVLSNQDHRRNFNQERVVELRRAAGIEDEPEREGAAVERPEEPVAHLRWWIDSDDASTGTGLNSLPDYAHHVRTYWAARHRRNLHLFHYADLEADLDGEMRRVAAALGVTVDEERWPAFVEAATFDAMKARASHLAPDTHLGLWTSEEAFFHRGGRREWPDLLTPAEVAAFEARLAAMVGAEAAAFALRGRSQRADNRQVGR